MNKLLFKCWNKKVFDVLKSLKIDWDTEVSKIQSYNIVVAESTDQIRHNFVTKTALTT